MVYFLLLFIIPIILFILYIHLQYDIYNLEEQFQNNKKTPRLDYDFNPANVVGRFKFYNKNFYPLEKNITEHEKKFILNWMLKLDINDFKNERHISPFTISVVIFKNGKINKSRFAIGTKTKFDLFKKETNELLSKMNIKIEPPKDYKYYGIAWDIEDELFKIYFLNNDNSKMICHIFKIKRNGIQISNVKLKDIKKYDVDEKVTLMYKEGKTVKQFNQEELPLELRKKYPSIKNFEQSLSFNIMHLELDTYSEYDNKLNLYYD